MQEVLAPVTPLTLISYDQGTMLGFKGFSAAMLGGIASPLGAVAGGIDRCHADSRHAGPPSGGRLGQHLILPYLPLQM